MPKKSNLIGQRFGKLTVISKAEETQDRYALWNCRCDCGGRSRPIPSAWCGGTIWNCGCVPKTNAKNGTIAEDLQGRRFGMLQVVKRVQNQHDRTSWLCRCDCGNLKIVQSNALKAGRVKSCGCLHRHTDDLTGQRFGRLVALYPIEKRDSKHSGLLALPLRLRQ